LPAPTEIYQKYRIQATVVELPQGKISIVQFGEDFIPFHLI
jgi:hypothetical protein